MWGTSDEDLVRGLKCPTGRLNTWRVLAALRVERARHSVCGACGAPAWLVPQPDRYFHADGSDNGACWLAYTRGEVR